MKSDEPVAGTWELNLARSTFNPGTMAPRSQSRTIQVNGDHEVGRHTVVGALGTQATVEYEVAYDGMPYPFRGSPDWDGLAVTRIDAHTGEFTQWRGGQPMLSGRRVISDDGNTMTISGKGTNAQGQAVDVVLVFDRR